MCVCVYVCDACVCVYVCVCVHVRCCTCVCEIDVGGRGIFITYGGHNSIHLSCTLYMDACMNANSLRASHNKLKLMLCIT